MKITFYYDNGKTYTAKDVKTYSPIDDYLLAPIKTKELHYVVEGVDDKGIPIETKYMIDLKDVLKVNITKYALGCIKKEETFVFKHPKPKHSKPESEG